MSKRRVLSFGFKILSLPNYVSVKGVVAKKSLLSFHTIDGNHSFTIISVHTFFSRIPFLNIVDGVIWRGSARI